MDESYQYGNVMTKPLPYSCMKNKKEFLAFKNFSWSSKTCLMKIKIGHLFILDMKFNEKLADEKVLSFSEIYTLLFEKKLIKPYERSMLQLLTVLQKTTKVCWTVLNSTEKLIWQWNRKPFCLSTLNICIFNKICRLDCHKNLRILHIWTVQILKKFCDQKSSLISNAKRSAGKDFYNLMSNANFGYNCKNDIDNCKFTVLYDEIEFLIYKNIFPSFLMKPKKRRLLINDERTNETRI